MKIISQTKNKINGQNKKGKGNKKQIKKQSIHCPTVNFNFLYYQNTECLFFLYIYKMICKCE